MSADVLDRQLEMEETAGRTFERAKHEPKFDLEDHVTAEALKSYWGYYQSIHPELKGTDIEIADVLSNPNHFLYEDVIGMAERAHQASELTKVALEGAARKKEEFANNFGAPKPEEYFAQAA